MVIRNQGTTGLCPFGRHLRPWVLPIRLLAEPVPRSIAATEVASA